MNQQEEKQLREQVKIYGLIAAFSFALFTMCIGYIAGAGMHDPFFTPTMKMELNDCSIIQEQNVYDNAPNITVPTPINFSTVWDDNDWSYVYTATRQTP